MPIVAFFGSRIVQFLRSVLFIFFEKPYRTAYALPRACVRAYIILKGTVEAFICSPENIRDSGQNKAPLHKGDKITTAIAVLFYFIREERSVLFAGGRFKAFPLGGRWIAEAIAKARRMRGRVKTNET